MHGPTTLLTTAGMGSVPSKPLRALTYNVPSTVILLDWDDTLFPNTYLSKQRYSLDTVDEPLSAQDQKLMELLMQHVASFLKSCVDSNRTVMIVTNGEADWVERSCKRFMLAIYPLVASFRIVSARAMYESSHPVEEWKVACFTSELTKHFFGDMSGRKRHIVSIGDSHYERQAVQRMSAFLPLAKTKSVKFIDLPSIPDMVRQLMLVSTYLSHLCTHPDHLDLILSREVLRGIAI
ncbi:hypothetical protein, variant 4 [Aphanomyces invadans]|uniref:FCP1 homology domain-containing protein n=1 Tax=Aphanomyces invadans TaxID=157072 RepID=A0A024TJC9_9STRA|nr:hypothetical protein, variant 1 [Aphanomyces invadans]XP_008877023.1 hypothetical protein, variant 3 [Aphanomyces invadans]XP_008877024.1 hypothetical protein, variant 2 [Aphanomyces invadans]XP_008877025.1 hypothetical protein, variant 4 [Aphanomyces invadans]XP_008877026.1 hypothetical protein H310_11935 [Aphanomyces invadans]ETV94260.1 hypothetical protein H310_11935 [Aphanomyces invadans]ETV94261.1 hypothetical protein, variant 1 [Aphanomyces invadans]ETV94262.1 hypothetical protein, |eukprot:XP_008877022.1 hypothetical protein, variant 1 [Aphanomyces invadans]